VFCRCKSTGFCSVPPLRREIHDEDSRLLHFTAVLVLALLVSGAFAQETTAVCRVL